jgi:hypothetical protein
MSNELLKLFEFCASHDLGFDYLHHETSRKSTIDYIENEKRVVITIYDDLDEDSLKKLISDKIVELKNLLD